MQPKTWDTDLTLYTADEVQMFEGSTIGVAIQQRLDLQAKNYQMIADMDPDFSLKYSMRDWLEVIASVTSRRFGYRLGGESVLVPLGDLFNHTDSPNANWKWIKIEEGNWAWIMQTLRDIKKGEEVRPSYGDYDNKDLLFSYGFILPGNSIPLKVDITYEAINLLLDDPLREAKREVIDSGFQIDKEFGSLTNANVRKQLRFVVFDDRDKIVETDEGPKVEYLGVGNQKTFSSD